MKKHLLGFWCMISVIIASCGAGTESSTKSGTSPSIGSAAGSANVMMIGDYGQINNYNLQDNTYLSSQIAAVEYNSIAYDGHERFVAVGEKGVIITSNDGLNWVTANTSNVTIKGNPFVGRSVTYGNGKFIAVGDAIITSTDGVNWIKVELPTERLYFTGFNGVTYAADKGKFIAVGNGSISKPSGSVSHIRIFSSNDGIIWAPVLDNEGSSLNNIIYANNTFTVVGNSNTILTSGDGVDWKRATVNTSDANYISVAYGNNKFLAIGRLKGSDARVIVTSSDGVKWRLSITMGKPLNSITYANNKFVAIGYDGVVSISNDGVNWTEQVSNTDKLLKGIVYGGNRFIVVGEGGLIMSSGDGVDWVVNSRVEIGRIASAAHTADGSFIAVGTSATIIRSDDNGANWTKVYGNNKLEQSGSFFGVAISDDSEHFVAVGRGAIGISDDGRSWSRVVVEGLKSVTLYDVIYDSNNRKFIAVGDDNTIIISSDGKVWDKIISGLDDHSTIHSIVFDKYNNQLMALRNGIYEHNNTIMIITTIMISKDGGKTWKQELTVPGELKALTYGDGKFVAVGEHGVIMTSSNGIDWKYPDNPDEQYRDLLAVTYNPGSGKFVAVGNGGDKSIILTSSDAIMWQQQFLGVPNDLNLTDVISW